MQAHHDSHTRNPKARGELTEIRFWLAAALRGLIACKPFGESQPFDFVVAFKGSKRFYRIQVKSNSYSRPMPTGSQSPAVVAAATPLAKFISSPATSSPTDTWYIIPVRLLTKRKLISVYPEKQCSRGMFEPFKERWQLLSR